MSKKSKKKTRPLEISVRGDGLRIEASFSESSLSENLTELVKRLNGANGSAGKPAPSAEPLSVLVAELAKSLRTEQVEALNKLFDMPQKVMFMEILSITKHEFVS